MIPLNKKINFHKILFVTDWYYPLGFLAYFIFSYIGRKFLLDDQTTPSFTRLGLTIFYETTGVQVQQHNRFLLINIAKAFYFFYIYVYFAFTSGKLIALMTDSAEDPRITEKSDKDNVLIVPYHYSFPQLKELTRDLIREPIKITYEELQRKQDLNSIAAVYNDRTVQGFRTYKHASRDYFIVSETFGEQAHRIRGTTLNITSQKS